MGFFDSKKTTKNENITNDYTTTTADNRINEQDLADNAIGIGGDVGGTLTINTTDQGAVSAGKELSLAALDYSNDSLEGALSFGSDALNGALGLGETAILSQQELANHAIDQVSTASAVNAQNYSDGLSQVLSFARSANTSEDGQLSQGLIKWGALVLIFVLTIPYLSKVIK
ncbi:hypothetical protein [Microbulbifer sp. SAOS-129_SWC]|uniref:hypothetical protein n=1 Tax=Microbulbifer sp. SAOS-129_SWC TaxID=3145235 RepID=UPI0032165E2A